MKLTPQLATLVDEVPQGDEWVHEIKFDGYRILCELDRGRVTLFSRNGRDWTRAFQPVADALKKLPAKRAILDGEVVSTAGDGSQFQNLQNALKNGGDFAYYVFDLLSLDGEDFTREPLHRRKAALARLLGKKQRGVVRYTAHLDGHGERLYREACRTSLEGIISKRRDRPYHPGRNLDWVKVKCHQEQELVIGGWTEPKGGRRGFGALLLGVNDNGRLRYAGKVGTGFDDRMLEDLHDKLVDLEVPRSPFVDAPRARNVHHVRPELVAQVVFTEWTAAGHLRHPSFKGLRADKAARSVIRERPRHMQEVESVKADGPLRVAGIALSHPHKILYPEQRVTKLELARYYEAVSGLMLPHVADRPLLVVRCPDGQSSHCFYQKHANPGDDAMMRVDSVQGLVSLVQLGVLEVHTWGARHPRIEHPDLIVMDLDPGPGVPWQRVVDGARRLRALFAELELESFVKTTGGKGLHVVVPVTASRLGWDDFKELTRRVAEKLVREEPDRYTATISKAKRAGKIFVDYLRNGRGSTAVAPYSTRARHGAPVAMPVAWSQIARVAPDQYTIRDVVAEIGRRRADPWKGLPETRQRLTKAMLKALR